MSKKLYTDLITTGTVSFITKTLGIVTGIIFPRLLGPSQWGLWSLTNGFIGILAPFAQLALSTALVTYIPKYKNNNEKLSAFVNSAYFMVISFSLIISLIIILLSSFLAESIFQDSRLTIFLIMGAFILFFRELQIMNSDYFRGFKNFRKYNLLKVVNSISRLLIPISLFMIFSYAAVYLAISHLIYVSVLSVGVLTYLHKKEEAFRIFKIPPKIESIRLLKFGIPLIFAGTFLIVMKSVDRIFIGYYFETADVGIYSVAASIPLFIGGAFLIINRVLLPTFSERHHEGKSSKVLLNEIVSLLLFVSIPLVIFLIFFSREVLWFVYGEQYVAGANILAITSLEIFLYSSSSALGNPINAAEKTVKNALGVGLAAGTNILLNISLIPIFGIEGAAIATVVGFLVLLIHRIYLCKKYYNFEFSRIYIKMLLLHISSLIFIGYVLTSLVESFLSLIFSAFIFLIISILLAKIFSPLWYKEMIEYIRNIF